MKKVLMITYDFPPARTSGIYRPLKFVKHLLKYDWQPLVLTTSNPYVQAFDYSLLRDIPSGTKIFRSPTVDLAKINDDIHKFLFGSNSESVAILAKGASSQVAGPNRKSWIKRAILSPLNRFAINWLYLPDSKILWLPLVIFKALKIIAREKPDVIYTTSFPPTTQVIGLMLKKLVGKPWIADFRDNWVVGFSQLYNSRKRVKFDWWLMGKIVEKADHIITMCNGNSKDIMNAYKDYSPQKYTSITNGYDEDDFPENIPQSSGHDSEKLCMLHMGTLYRHTSGLFFEALAELLQENTEIRMNLELTFIGYISDESASKISRFNLSRNIRKFGFKPHPEAITAMISADVLMLFLGGFKILNQQFPGKFFEYLQCRRTILAIGQAGEIAEVLEKSRCGVLVRHDDKEQIKKAILNIYKRKKEGQLLVKPDYEYIRQYEYRNLTKMFAGVLDKAAKADRKILRS